MKTKSLTKVTLLSIFVMAVITAVTLNSCQKESIKPKVTDLTNKSAGASNIDGSSSLIIDEANNLLFGSSNSEKGLIPSGAGYDTSSCVIRTFDTVHKPYTVSYNYGSGCLGNDGKTRAGIVSVTYSDKDIRVVNNSMTATFQNYSVNGTTVNGSLNLVNNGPDPNGNQVIAETGMFISSTQTETDTLAVNYQIEWLSGEFSTPGTNWQFSITGAIHGGTSTGRTVDITINNPLIKNARNPGCNFFIQGTEQVAVSGEAPKYRDFGNPGGCSGLKSVTQNGVTTVTNQ